MNVEHYVTESGYDPFQDWFNNLRNRQAKAKILQRIVRASLGNFGDHKFCRDGVSEMRINIGPGYRIYYFQHGITMVVLLCGGNKSTQDDDISEAVSYRDDYLSRITKE